MMRTNSREAGHVYRRLQRHLDRQAVGFPATWTGADIRLLRHLFSPEEAEAALFLSYRPMPEEQFFFLVADRMAPGDARARLDGMFEKGAIARRERDGQVYWNLMPLVVGMYEGKDGNPSRAFIEDADRYMSTFGFGRALLNADPPQMRTIPVNRSIEVEPNRVATFDQVEGIVASAQGPFVVIPCICRERKALHGEPCQKTTRRETCLGFNEMAAMILARGHGREVDREEVLDILEESQKEGLVLQPANTRSPDFICSCCGCCCGMLNMQKMLPHPAEFWARRFMAYVDHDACSGCGRCVDRCQVGAVSLSGKDSPVAVVNDARCIGCGLCVTTCRPAAIRLQPIEDSVLPPRDEDELYEEIKSNRRGAWAQFQTLLRVAIGYLRQ